MSTLNECRLATATHISLTLSLEVSTRLEHFSDHTFRDDRAGEGLSNGLHLDTLGLILIVTKQPIEVDLHVDTFKEI